MLTPPVRNLGQGSRASGFKGDLGPKPQGRSSVPSGLPSSKRPPRTDHREAITAEVKDPRPPSTLDLCHFPECSSQGARDGSPGTAAQLGVQVTDGQLTQLCRHGGPGGNLPNLGHSIVVGSSCQDHSWRGKVTHRTVTPRKEEAIQVSFQTSESLVAKASVAERAAVVLESCAGVEVPTAGQHPGHPCL